MIYITTRSLAMICLMAITVSNFVIAKGNKENISWLTEQIQKHPQLMAAKEMMNAQLYEADGLDKAIYNPVLSSDFGQEGSNRTYTLGINQRLDFTNKTASRRQQAVFARTVAKVNYELLMQQKMAEAYNALISWKAALKRSELVSKQEKQLEELLEIVNRRNKSGDLGQLDAELTYLSLSQGFGQTARIQAQLKRAEMNLKNLLPDWHHNTIDLPKNTWNSGNKQYSDELVSQHPTVQFAKAQWQESLLIAEIEQKNKKADPTIGFEAGKLGGDDVISLTFSMPLYVRNNFSMQYKAANQKAIAAESKYYAAKRKQNYAIEASKSALIEYKSRYEKWRTLMQGRAENSENLLQKQWSVGDISTTEYLLTLQQRTESLLAGIELEQEYQFAQVQLLLDTGQLYSTQPSTEVSQ